MVFGSGLCLTCGVIYYYYIIHILLYYYTLHIYYYILSYTILSSSLPLLLFHPSLPISYSSNLHTSTYIQSIRVGPSLCLFIFSSDLSNNPKVLTPHKLTDGNVEWCSLYLYRVGFRAGVLGSDRCFISVVFGLCFDPAQTNGVDG